MTPDGKTVLARYVQQDQTLLVLSVCRADYRPTTEQIRDSHHGDSDQWLTNDSLLPAARLDLMHECQMATSYRGQAVMVHRDDEGRLYLCTDPDGEPLELAQGVWLGKLDQ